MPVNPIPAGQEAAAPYLIVDAGARALEFYQQAFGAEVLMRLDAPGGKVGHAEFTIGRARVMLADEYPEMGYRSPRALGGTPVSIHIYVEDTDAMVRRAQEAGAKVQRAVADQFYGDRNGTIEDPFGHVWTFASRIEELTLAQMEERARAAAARS
jgi:PhnB protein